MSRSSHSLKTELSKIQAQLAELMEARKPPKRWIPIEVQPGEDKSAEIAAIEAQGDHVLIRQITRPAPRVLDQDELTPELKLIKEQAELEHEIEMTRHDRDNWQQRVIEQKRDEERPFPLTYPKQVF